MNPNFLTTTEILQACIRDEQKLQQINLTKTRRKTEYLTFNRKNCTSFD